MNKASIKHSNVTKAGSLGGASEIEEAFTKVELPCNIAHANNREFDTLLSAMYQEKQSLVNKYERVIKTSQDQAEAVFNILKKACMSVKLTGIGNPEAESQIYEKIKSLTKKQVPLIMALPMGGGKVAVELKTGNGYLPDTAEWEAWNHLAAIAEAISTFYRPGAKIVVVGDAMLHTADLGMNATEAAQHLNTAQQDLKMLNIADFIKLPDPLKSLPDNWSKTIADQRRKIIQKTHNDAAFTNQQREQTESLVYSLNTRVYELKRSDYIRMFAALKGSVKGISAEHRLLAANHYQRSEQVTANYTAVNYAIRATGLISRVVKDTTGAEDSLRLSVHAKPLEFRPLLFESGRLVRNAGLLPMHGTGVVGEYKGKLHFGIDFDIALRIRGFAKVYYDGRPLFYRWTEHHSEPHLVDSVVSSCGLVT
ncbi:Pyoverdine/dityrosine biosynthesis protein [Gimesia fumaroli]|uniref:Pyoverdine/dityrosine biosynthesis protein n=2 Tax=Gimesia fumaroli TaxID=2527976 RepID=A0A518IK72_9PLAN|nr:Pyoverdine/dityrosine biosynthesis protein [Gimesia fumaroli]